MEQAEEHNEEEDLEEGEEKVGVAAEEEDEGDEGWEAAIEDSRAHVNQGRVSSLSFASGHGQEGVADVH